MDRTRVGEDENRDRMDEMIKHGLIPNVDQPIPLDNGFKGVRTKGAERYGQEAKSGTEANERRHNENYCMKYGDPASAESHPDRSAAKWRDPAMKP